MDNYHVPGKVAAQGLPPVLEVRAVWSAVLQAIEFFLDEGTDGRIIHGIRLVENPFSLKKIAGFSCGCCRCGIFSTVEMEKKSKKDD